MHQPAASIRIGDRLLGDGQPCFVIAEIGNNHNGDYDRAIALVDAAVAAGADCAKFQMRKLDEVYRASSLSGKDDDLAVEYTLDLLRRFELTDRPAAPHRGLLRLERHSISLHALGRIQRRDAGDVRGQGLQGRLRRPDQSSPAGQTRRDRQDADRLDRHEHDARKSGPRRNFSTTARRPMCCCIARAPIRPRSTTFICVSWKR